MILCPFILPEDDIKTGKHYMYRGMVPWSIDLCSGRARGLTEELIKKYIQGIGLGMDFGGQ